MEIEGNVAHICKLSRAEDTITQPVLKFGGTPVFYEETDSPKCSQCGQRMDLIGQITLKDPQRLSEKFDMAYVFMCLGKFDERGGLLCETYSAFSGANAVLLQRKSGHLFIPKETANYPDYIVDLTPEIEPDIDVEDLSLDEELVESVSEETKIGGTPLWLQTNETPLCVNCVEPMRFIAQINPELDGPYLARHTKEQRDSMNHLKFGMGYVFICQDECHSESAAFLWQCD